MSFPVHFYEKVRLALDPLTFKTFAAALYLYSVRPRGSEESCRIERKSLNAYFDGVISSDLRRELKLGLEKFLNETKLDDVLPTVGSCLVPPKIGCHLLHLPVDLRSNQFPKSTSLLLVPLVKADFSKKTLLPGCFRNVIQRHWNNLNLNKTQINLREIILETPRHPKIQKCVSFVNQMAKKYSTKEELTPTKKEFMTFRSYRSEALSSLQSEISQIRRICFVLKQNACSEIIFNNRRKMNYIDSFVEETLDNSNGLTKTRNLNGESISVQHKNTITHGLSEFELFPRAVGVGCETIQRDIAKTMYFSFQCTI